MKIIDKEFILIDKPEEIRRRQKVVVDAGVYKDDKTHEIFLTFTDDEVGEEVCVTLTPKGLAEFIEFLQSLKTEKE